MRKSFFSRNKPLLETYEKVLLKNSMKDDWEEVEVNSLLPAESFKTKDGEYKRGRMPSTFSLGSIITIAFMLITIIPFLIFGYSVVRIYLRRTRKLKEIRNLQYDIRSTFPRVFDPERDEIVGEEERRMYQILCAEQLIIHCSHSSSANSKLSGKIINVEA